MVRVNGKPTRSANGLMKIKEHLKITIFLLLFIINCVNEK